MAGDPYARFGLTLEGWAFPGGSSRKVPARLITRAPLDGKGDAPFVDIVDADDRVIAAAHFDDVVIDPPLGRSPRRMNFPDEAMFETDDHYGVRALTGQTRGDLLSDYEAFRPRLVAVIAALVLCGWVIWRYGLDLMVSAAIALTPAGLLGYMDQGTLQTIDLTMAEETGLPEAERDRVGQIFSTLLAELPASEINDRDFKLLFRSMERIGPNAFAMPGGTIVMTDQFVEKFPQDDVLAGVLGHEIGHVVESHGLRQTYRSLGIYFLIGFLAGDTGPIIDEILLEGNLLLSLQFSRKHEASADAFGVRLTADAGYDPAGLQEFFREIAKGGLTPPQWLSTHPSSDERVKQIEGYINALD